MRKSIDFVKKVLTFQPANDKMIKSLESEKENFENFEKTFWKTLDKLKTMCYNKQADLKRGQQKHLEN